VLSGLGLGVLFVGEEASFAVRGGGGVEVGGGPVLAAVLESQRAVVAGCLLEDAEAVVVDEADRLDGVGGRDARVVDGDEVVAVLVLASGGEVDDPAYTTGVSSLKSTTTNLWWMTCPAPPLYSA
jgi:hypothetical protein